MTNGNKSSKTRESVFAIASVLTAVLISMACLTGPSTSVIPSAPWEPVDSAWKVIENLEYAYNTMDIDLYMSCFREDFEFHLLYFNPHGCIAKQDSFWGYTEEEQIHLNMFNDVPMIDLSLSGTSEYPWTGDSTGQSYQLDRYFNLKVFTSLFPAQGYMASGTTLFICRPDTVDDQWYIWLWYDLSDTKEQTTWGALKEMFFY